MPVTDIHAHIVPAGLPERLQSLGMTNSFTLKPVDDGMLMFEYANGKRHGPIPKGLVDVEQRLRDMDAQGVDVQVLATAPMLFAYSEPADIGTEVCRLTNDAMLTVAEQHSDRFQVFASLPMQDPSAAVSEIKRCAAEDAVRGVQIGTNIAGQNFDEPWLDPVWAALEEHDMPALLHPWAPLAGAERLGRYHLSNLIGNPLDTTVAVASLTFGGVLQRHPQSPDRHGSRWGLLALPNRAMGSRIPVAARSQGQHLRSHHRRFTHRSTATRSPTTACLCGCSASAWVGTT